MYGLAIANIMEKVRIGPTIVWIGWEFHISAGFIVLPSLKRDKLLSLIEKLLSSSPCSGLAIYHQYAPCGLNNSGLALA